LFQTHESSSKNTATVYDNEALLHMHVAKWFKRFIQGCENPEDDPRSGQPSTTQNVGTDAEISLLVAKNQMALKLKENQLHINQIFHEDLGNSKACVKFVPHSFSHK
jgi:hypothetical protein